MLDWNRIDGQAVEKDSQRRCRFGDRQMLPLVGHQRKRMTVDPTAACAVGEIVLIRLGAFLLYGKPGKVPGMIAQNVRVRHLLRRRLNPTLDRKALPQGGQIRLGLNK